MRFLVSEKAYETPVASGRLRYERDGVDAGIVESWRLTTTSFGAQILRIDYDCRAADGRSFLFHLITDEEGHPQRLVYRYLHDRGGAISGNVLCSAESMLNSRNVDATHIEDELPPLPLLIPTVIGVGFAARALREFQHKSTKVALLDIDDTGDRLLQLKPIEVNVHPQRTRDLKIVTVGQTPHRATTLSLAWHTQMRTVWLDLAHKWPLKATVENGLTAHETRYVRYLQPQK